MPERQRKETNNKEGGALNRVLLFCFNHEVISCYEIYFSWDVPVTVDGIRM